MGLDDYGNKIEGKPRSSMTPEERTEDNKRSRDAKKESALKKKAEGGQPTQERQNRPNREGRQERQQRQERQERQPAMPSQGRPAMPSSLMPQPEKESRAAMPRYIVSQPAMPSSLRPTSAARFTAPEYYEPSAPRFYGAASRKRVMEASPYLPPSTFVEQSTNYSAPSRQPPLPFNMQRIGSGAPKVKVPAPKPEYPPLVHLNLECGDVLLLGYNTDVPMVSFSEALHETGLASTAGLMLQALGLEVADEIELNHVELSSDQQFSEYPELGAAIKDAGSEYQTVFCVATCPGRNMYGVGLGGKLQFRENVAKLALCVALAPTKETSCSEADDAFVTKYANFMNFLSDGALPGLADATKGGAGGLNHMFYAGVVKSFNEEKGYGFICCDATKALYGQDIFLMRSALRGCGDHLATGDKVSFRVRVASKGPQANQVKSMMPGANQDCEGEAEEEEGEKSSVGRSTRRKNNKRKAAEAALLGESDGKKAKSDDAEEDYEKLYRWIAKRSTCVITMKDTTEYRKFAELRIQGRVEDLAKEHGIEAPTTPDANDTKISKRAWENSTQKWRSSLKVWADKEQASVPPAVD